MDAKTETLIQAAKTVRSRAYAPYSGYLVGAAVLDEEGRVHVGVNVENISYGLTICAERNAVARMIADGGRHVCAVVVVTQDGGSPCGACRQVLSEFAAKNGRTPVYCVDETGRVREYDLGDLLPAAFESGAVGRTPSRLEGSTE